MALVGGLRARVIRDSLYLMLRQSLDDLGWFDPDRDHSDILFISEPVDSTESIERNTLSLAPDSVDDFEFEMGSMLSENTWLYWMEFYAEDDTLGFHLIHDVKDILQGRMPTIDRGYPNVDVYDFSQATPPYVFTCQIDNVSIDTARNVGQSWRATWFGCSFEITDWYEDEYT